jgi:hypothetical protein
MNSAELKLCRWVGRRKYTVLGVRIASFYYDRPQLYIWTLHTHYSNQYNYHSNNNRITIIVLSHRINL